MEHTNESGEIKDCDIEHQQRVDQVSSRPTS